MACQPISDNSCLIRFLCLFIDEGIYNSFSLVDILVLGDRMMGQPKKLSNMKRGDIEYKSMLNLLYRSPRKPQLPPRLV